MTECLHTKTPSSGGFRHKIKSAKIPEGTEEELLKSHPHLKSYWSLMTGQPGRRWRRGSDGWICSKDINTKSLKQSIKNILNQIVIIIRCSKDGLLAERR